MMIDFGFDLAERREPRLLRAFALGTGAAAIETLFYFEVWRVLDAVLNGTADRRLLVEVSFVMFAGTIVMIALSAMSNVQGYGAVYRLVADAKLTIADHLSRVPMGTVARLKRGVLTDLLTGQFGLYQDIVTRAWGLAVVNAGLPLFLFGLLAVLQWRMALVTAVFAALAFCAIPWSMQLLSRAQRKLAPQREALVTRLIEQAEGARDLRIYDAENLRQTELRHRLDQFEERQLRTELAPAPSLLAFASLLQVGFAGAVIVGAFTLTREPANAPAIVIYLVVVLRFQRCLHDLGLNLIELHFTKDVIARIRDLKRIPAVPEGPITKRVSDPSIRFECVSFAFGDDAAAVHCIDGAVPAGCMLALVGPSGSGKSTVASLVARLWDPDDGRITIGGIDLRDLDHETLARTVAVVLQEPVLFEGTILDNIRLGRHDASRSQVEQVARAARAHEFITALPDGYETVLDTEGGALSGGEKQRIAIARALLVDAPVMVLDEATASIDVTNEAEILAALAALARGRTVIAIAHRLWTVRNADEIWVLDNGHVIQRGQHADLYANAAGYYRRAWNAQMPV